MDLIKEPVMANPHDKNSTKTDKIGHEYGPLTGEVLPERRAGRKAFSPRYLQIKDQESNGNGEHAVTKCLDARGFFFFRFVICRFHRVFSDCESRFFALSRVPLRRNVP